MSRLKSLVCVYEGCTASGLKSKSEWLSTNTAKKSKHQAFFSLQYRRGHVSTLQYIVLGPARPCHATLACLHSTGNDGDLFKYLSVTKKTFSQRFEVDYGLRLRPRLRPPEEVFRLARELSFVLVNSPRYTTCQGSQLQSDRANVFSRSFLFWLFVAVKQDQPR